MGQCYSSTLLLLLLQSQQEFGGVSKLHMHGIQVVVQKYLIQTCRPLPTLAPTLLVAREPYSRGGTKIQT